MPNIPKLRLMLARMEKSAGWMDTVQRAIAKLPTRVLPIKGAGVTKEELPWRDRVEVYTQNPKGKIYGGIWDNDKSFALPGGGIDEGEDPLLAALRELKEETGITAKNPRLLPIDPVDSPWSDAHRAKLKRNFAGSRTHFVLADAMGGRGNKNLDVWNASNRGYYTPAKAIDIMNSNTNYMAPTAAAARLKALQHIQSLAMAAAKEKSAGVTKEELIHDDVLTKHAGIAQLGMAAAKGLYGLGAAAVKSPIAQNIATGASNLVNSAGNLANTAIQSPMVQSIATRAGNLANSAVQSRAGKALITGAENLHEGTVNLANRAIQNPIVSRLYAGANKLTDAAIQSPMTPDFIKNTFKPGFAAGRQSLRRTSREWVPNWDEPGIFRPMPKQPVSSGPNISPDHVFRRYKIETTPLMPSSAKGVYWTGGRDQISVRGPRGTDSEMRVMRHELTHGLQHNLPSNFSSLHTASTNSPFAGSFLREMNANAAMSRTPLGQMGRAIGYATSPERLQAYWNGYKPMDKLLHGAGVGTAYGVPIAAGLTAGGVGAYEGLHSLASRMQPTNLPHNPEFAQAGPPNPHT